jgi:hypothetical protein
MSQKHRGLKNKILESEKTPLEIEKITNVMTIMMRRSIFASNMEI